MPSVWTFHVHFFFICVTFISTCICMSPDVKRLIILQRNWYFVIFEALSFLISLRKIGWHQTDWVWGSHTVCWKPGEPNIITEPWRMKQSKSRRMKQSKSLKAAIIFYRTCKVLIFFLDLHMACRLSSIRKWIEKKESKISALIEKRLFKCLISWILLL